MKDLWTLDPGVTFLNHGSFGACPRPVLEAQQRLRDEMEREPVRFLSRDLQTALDGARATLAAFLGADPDDLAFVPNATTGVNTVLRSLRLGPGDEILVTDHAYGACRNAAEVVAAATGARVVLARVPFPLPGVEPVVDGVLAAVTNRTRLALLDHVTSPTGLVFPLALLVTTLQAREVDVLVDGAHAPGMIPLDLEALGAAYYTGNCHKWLCAPKGAAFLHVRRDRQPRLRPLVISHGATSPRTDRSRFRLEFDWTGTDDPTAYLAVPAALRTMGELLPGGWPALMAHNRALALDGRRILAETLGVSPPCPDDMVGSLASVPLPGAPPGGPDGSGGWLQGELFSRSGIEVPIMTWPGPPHLLVRISAQAYNTPEDYRRLARALTILCPPAH